MAKRNISADINRPLSVTVTGGGVAATGGGGGGTLPGTITPTTGNTVTGGRHTHRMLPTHAALPDIGPADHHDPVTVGNTGLSVSGQQVSLRLATVSGLEISSGLRLADSIAGDGLTIASKVLAVGVSGLGLSVGADAVTLTSSSNPGAAASILASDASGYLQLTRLGLNRAPLYPLHVAGATQQVRVDYNDSNHFDITVGSDGSTNLATTTGGAAGNLTLLPAGDLILDPTGRDVLPAENYDIRLGSSSLQYLALHVAELWAQTFVVQEMIATIGGNIIVAPSTELVRGMGTGSDAFSVKHNQLRDNDRVLLKSVSKVEFMAISAYDIDAVDAANDVFRIVGDYTSRFTAGVKFTVDGSTGNDGEWTVVTSSFDATYTRVYVVEDITSAIADGHILYIGAQGSESYQYRVTRDLDGSGANTWYAGDAVVNTGVTGDGFIDIYSVNGVVPGSTEGPTIVGNVRNSTTYNDWSEHWAIGNLNGLYGYGTTAYGAAFGRYANNSSFLTADATNGIRILKRASGANTTLAQWAMDGGITIGEVAPGQGNVQISAGAIALRVNTTETIKLYSTGAAQFGQVATDKGNMYWNPSNNRLEFRGSTNGTVVQAYVDTDGSIVAGTGKVNLNATGLVVTVDAATYEPTEAIKFAKSGTNVGVWYYYDIGSHIVSYLSTGNYTNRDARFYIESKAISATYAASLVLRAVNTSNTASVNIASGSGASNRVISLSAENINALGSLNVEAGLNLGTATGAGAGQVFAKSASYPVVRGERTSANTSSIYGALAAKHTTSGNMADGFGASIAFHIEDDAGTDNVIGEIGAAREGADNSGALKLYGYSAGARGSAVTVNSIGDVIAPGSFACGAAMAVFFGTTDIDGRWRIIRSGNDLLVQRRVSGSWVTKHTFAA